MNSFSANLTGSQETIPNASTATGFGSVLLNNAENLITVNLSWTGLTAPASAAHIHGPALQGSNAPVLFGFTGVPNAITGQIPQQSFSITPTQVNYLKTGQLYFNIHNSVFPPGEIRGQIQQVPEPMTLLGSMAAIAFGSRLNRKFAQKDTQQKEKV
ncbi:MAG: PEP-CTERM sorting domain-containing protein [Snowella sp.]|nr:PEP-CTERM sorting domain-containing protein [Snowella sp.]